METQLTQFLTILNTYLETKGRVLQESEITVDAPVKLSDVLSKIHNRNSRVKLTNVEDENDWSFVYYNRLNVKTLFGNEAVPINLDFVDVASAVFKLNETYGTDITLDDIKSSEMIEGHRAKITIGKSLKYLEDSSIIIYPLTDLTKFEDFSERIWNIVNYRLPEMTDKLGVILDGE